MADFGTTEGREVKVWSTHPIDETTEYSIEFSEELVGARGLSESVDPGGLSVRTTYDDQTATHRYYGYGDVTVVHKGGSGVIISDKHRQRYLYPDQSVTLPFLPEKHDFDIEGDPTGDSGGDSGDDLSGSGGDSGGDSPSSGSGEDPDGSSDTGLSASTISDRIDSLISALKSLDRTQAIAVSAVLAAGVLLL